MTDYWLRGRRYSSPVSRRRALKLGMAGIAGLGGAALVGCGGDSESGSITAPTAVANAPRRGGHFRYAVQADPDTLDQLTAKSFRSARATAAVYSRLLKYDSGDGVAAPGTVSGDLAKSWEVVDQTTINFSLRPGVTWDERPPTNGRAFTSEDVVQSWKKFSVNSTYKADVANSANKNAPIASMTALDNSTVQVKLAFPDATFADLLAWPYYFWVHPIESMNGGFNPSAEMRGTGPWILREHRPAVGLIYDRNPKWYGAPDLPRLDSFEEVVIAEPAQAESQFRAGNTLVSTQVATENLPAILKTVPGTQIDLGAPTTGGTSFGFSWQKGQPWHDERVRRALAMSIDRDALVDVVMGAEDIRAAGIKVRAYWNTPLSGGYGAFWLDPKSPAFGEHGKNFSHNVAEARALLAAAGYSNAKPLTFELQYATQYGAQFVRRAEVIEVMARDAGIRMVLNPVDYTSHWVPNVLRKKGDFASSTGSGGVAGHWTNGGRSSAIDWLSGIMHSGGANNLVGKQFPALDAMIAAARATFDTKERIAKTHDIQRYMAQWMPTVPTGPLVDSITVFHQQLNGVHLQTWGGGPINFGSAVESFPYYWLSK